MGYEAMIISSLGQSFLEKLPNHQTPKNFPNILKSMKASLHAFTAVTMKNAIFWDVTPCSSCKNRRLVGTYCLHHQGEKNQQARTLSATDSS
jgi:hypothetical protein